MRILAAIAVVLAACGPLSAPPPRAAEPPRLVVLVVIDQLPAWAFAAKLPELHGGLARAVREGRWYTGEYPSAATLTAAGHATLGTGASPRDTGILANEWWRRDLGRELAAVEAADGAVSSATLRLPGIADALAAASPESRAIGIALKARAALLPLGQAAGTAIWYDPTRPGWTARGDRPAWLDALERDAPIAPRIATPWQPRDPAWLARVTGIADDASGEVGTHGMDATFPHAIAGAPDPAKAVVATPLGNDLVVEAAIAAIAGASLGRDAAPDFLSVSFSAHDYVAHAWGQESWEAWDALCRLDVDLGRLFAALDREVGTGQWAAIVTSDHGAPAMPERSGRGSRHSYAAIEAAAEAALVPLLGPGDRVAAVRFPTVYLGAIPPARRDAAIDAVVVALRDLPWLAGVDRTDRYTGDCAAMTGARARWCWALDPAASGEVVFGPAEHVVVHEPDEVTATSHGSVYAYDYQVPVIVLGPGLAPGRAPAPVSMLRVAPTLARWLGVAPPAGARAAPLP